MEVELGQRLWIVESADAVVGQVDRVLHHGYEQQYEREDESDKAGGVGQDGEEYRCDEEDGDNLNTGDIEVFAVFVDEAPHAVKHGRMKPDAIGKLREALIDEVVADVLAAELHARVFPVAGDGLAREIQRDLGDLHLSAIGEAGDERDPLAIELAGLKIHARVGLGGVEAELLIEDDQRLDEVDPVSIRDGAQAFEAQGELGRGDGLR